MVVERSGVPEVDGEYRFHDFKCNAGYFIRRGTYNQKSAKFTLYKCSLKNGGFQWFISVTPETMDPGTNNDIDFYFAIAKNVDKLPPNIWQKISANHAREPAPKVQCVRMDRSDSSDSDNDQTNDSNRADTSSQLINDDEDDDDDELAALDRRGMNNIHNNHDQEDEVHEDVAINDESFITDHSDMMHDD